jgi:hypothetical protein
MIILDWIIGQFSPFNDVECAIFYKADYKVNKIYWYLDIFNER